MWFDKLEIRDADEAVIPLEQFIADGKRWWDALYARDPQTSGRGIVPAWKTDHLGATGKGVFNWEFSVTNKKGWVTDLRIPFWAEKAIFNIDEKEYEVRRDRGRRFDHAYSLKSGDELIAKAKVNASYFRFRGFTIFYSGRSLELEAHHYESSLLGRIFFPPININFYLLENNWHIGSIFMSWEGMFFKRRKGRIDLLDKLPMPVKVFIFSLVVLSYRATVDESPG